MEIEKKKYKQEEVKSLVDELSSDYENKIRELKEKIYELSNLNGIFKAELDSYKDKDDQISLALKSAEEKAEEIKQTSYLNYDLEIEKLNNFSDKWEKYFNYLKEKYPLYPAVNKAVVLKEKIDAILNLKEESVDKIEKLMAETKDVKEETFNPQAKINEYIAATSDNGFNLDEVLNPGELELEGLCKELGLMEDEQ